MRFKALFLALGLLGLVQSAEAATTFAGGDCDASLTLSGGNLTITSTANADRGCRANVAKYSGKWYYEVTMTTPGAFAALTMGVANNGTSQPVVGGYVTNGGASATGSWSAMGCLNIFGHLSRTTYANFFTADGVACAAGKKAGLAFDLDSNPPQIWATPDVTSLLCDGSGGSGSTNPKWNGDCASDPSLATTGGPTLPGGIKGMALPGYGYFPLYSSGATGAVVTFNFAGPFAIAAVPTGFSSWDTAGGAIPSPGPLTPMTMNIANAPGWQQSHAYTLGDRVVAGPGWTAGSPGSYTDGSNLYLWAVTVAGTSSGSGNGPQTCGTPTATGGGLNGAVPSTWSGGTTASDGGVTWVCLTRLDYVTLTGAFNDPGTTNWAATTGYTIGQYVLKSGGIYALYAVSSGVTCTSGATGPTGTTVGLTSADNTCTWTYMGRRTYSSLANVWPHMTTPHADNIWELQFSYNVIINVWYGGAQQRRYQAGQNSEAQPLYMYGHIDYINDQHPNCQNSYFNYSIMLVDTEPACNGSGMSWYWILQAAAGDSFQENVAPASQALRVDETKGVTFYSNTPFAAYGTATTIGEILAFSDSFGLIKRIQFQSTQSECIAATGGGPGSQHTNSIKLYQSIFDCGGGKKGIGLDAAIVFQENVIIWRQTTTGGTALWFKYAPAFLNNTIVCAGGTTVSAIYTGAYNFGPTAALPPPWKGNVTSGCTVQWGYNQNWTSTDGASNATDQASGSSGTYVLAVDGTTANIRDLPGIGSTCVPPGNSSTCYSLTPANVFTNPTVGSTIDLRIKSAQSPIYGGAATYSVTPIEPWMSPLAPSFDIFNTARPIGSRYDIGAQEFVNPLSGLFPVPW